MAYLGAFGSAAILGCNGTGLALGDGSAGANDLGADDLATAGNRDQGAALDDLSTCNEIPDETGGPYPDIDGMIANTKYQRIDITEGLTGTPLKLTLQLVNVAQGCAPVAGARVIIWHCDANGVYSEYASNMNSDPAQNDVGSTTTTFLRGWQSSDSAGLVSFTTIYPGWYSPRVTHIHVMVYNPSNLQTPVKTTQFAFPDNVNAVVYAQSALYPKGQNPVDNASDMVFSAGTEFVLASVTGDAVNGYAAVLPVGLAAY